MNAPDGPANTNRAAELVAAVVNFRAELQVASANFSPTPPTHARTCVRNALIGVIKFIFHLYPNDPTLPLPLNQLLYDLFDLDHGKVGPLLKATKVPSNPGISLSDAMFRAIAAAAMSRLVEDTKMSRVEAAQDIARRLSKMGAKQSSGKPIGASQIGKWRETMMAGLASEDRAVARYKLTLELVAGAEALKAVSFLMDQLPYLSPTNFPRIPPA